MKKIQISKYKGNIYLGDLEELNLEQVIKLFSDKMNEHSFLTYDGQSHLDILENREESDEEFKIRKKQVEKKLLDDENEEKKLFLKLLEKYGK